MTERDEGLPEEKTHLPPKNQKAVTVLEISYNREPLEGGSHPSGGWGVRDARERGWGGELTFHHQAALMDQSLHGTLQSIPRSKYVRTPLPAATFLGFPVASLIDMDCLTCDPVLAALEPKCLVVLMRCAF